MGSKLEYLAPKGARGKGSLPNTAGTGGASTNNASAGVGGNIPGPTTQPKLPTELRPYIREVEAKSGLTVHLKQRELLAQDLRQNAYTKLEGEALKAHQDLYTRSMNKRLITEWEHMGGSTKVREWPRYEVDIPSQSGGIARKAGWKHDAHHINPQELGGKNEWWNMHPIPFPDHQKFVHGADSILTQIVKEVS